MTAVNWRQLGKVRVAISTFLVVHIRLNLEDLRQKYGGIRAEVYRAEVGGPITVARGTSERQKKPSVTRSFNRLLLASVCHGRGRGFEPRRPRHTFQMTYGTYGPIVTSKSGFDMGAVRVLPPILRVFFILNFTQIWNHHLHNLALCCPLVRVHRLCVDIQRDPAIRVWQ